jgi:parallel beta-helix repeat protein
MLINRMIKSALRIGAGLVLVLTFSAPQSTVHASTYTVINTNNSGIGSLRQAIEDANAHVGADTIVFAIPDTDPGFGYRTANVWTIVLTSGELLLTDSGTTIDGSTQGEYNAFGPEIEVTQSSSITNVFTIQTSSTLINRLCITGGYTGVHLLSGSSGNIITNNYIGLDCLQSTPVPNTIGIRLGIESGSNQVVANFISGNLTDGVQIAGSGGNTLISNFIGTNQKALDVGNGGNGINISDGAGNNIIGNSRPNRNIISMNDLAGIRLDNSDTNQLSYNYIGTDYIGILGLGNLQNGIYITNGSTNTQVTSNLISGNGQSGIYVTGEDTDSTYIFNNAIGTDASGVSDVGNNIHGVHVTGGADSTTIQNNLISGNGQHGVSVQGTSVENTTISLNYIGANTYGNAVIGNDYHGVAIYDGPTSTTISHNLILGSGWSGLVFVNANNNDSHMNYIGVSPHGGSNTLGNAYYGIHILGYQNTVTNDTIAYNGLPNPASGDGIRVDGTSSDYNTISQVSIYGNGGKGIENINGGNNDLAGPTLNEIPSCTYVSGSVPSMEASIDIYSGPDDEGKTWLVTVLPYSLGNFEWTGAIPGPYVSATWTDGDGNTSEFSSFFACPRFYLPVIVRP